MSENAFPKFKNDETYYYIYNWDLELLSAKNDKVKVLPKSIVAINKKLDYIGSFLPSLIMKVKIPKEDLFKLKDNEKDIIASITIKCKRYIRENEELKLIESSVEASGVFSVVFAPSTFKGFLRREEYEDGSKYDNGGFSQSPVESGLATVTMSLIDTVGAKTAKQIFNECFDGKSNITVGTLLNYLISNTPVKGCIVDKPDNDQSYTQDLIIPPLNFVTATRYLQNMIGCYEHGMLTFYDDDVLYVLNRFADDHDVKKNETNLVHLYITESDKQPSTSILGSTNKNNESMYLGAISFNPKNNQIMQSEINGDNFIFSSFRLGLDAIQFKDKTISGSKPVSMVLKHNTESHSQSGTKNVLDYDELNNPFNMASEFNMIEATAETVDVIVKNANIIDFRPNKFVQLHFKDNRKELDYGGKYYILSVIEIYEKTGMQPDSNEISIAKKENKNLDSLTCTVALSLSRRKK